MKVSIILPTYDRPKDIIPCLMSIINNKFKDYEVLVVDQSRGYEIEKYIFGLSLDKIRHLRCPKAGKAFALNFGIVRSKGEIIVFTDDDCIVNKNWLSAIYGSFQKYAEIAAVTGRSLPFRPRKHPNEICPITFQRREKRKMITRLSFHATKIGFGNNFAIKKRSLEQIGGFKEWLSPSGKPICNAEDAEILLRLLYYKQKILYNKDSIVYHNRWLTPEQYQNQLLWYHCGELACYGYFAFQGHFFAKRIVLRSLRLTWDKIRGFLSFSLRLKKSPIKIGYLLAEIYVKLRGLLIGYYFSQQDVLQIN